MTPPRDRLLGDRRVDVTADLRVDIDGAPDAVRVTADGSRVRVAVADAGTAARIARDGYGLGGARETLAALTGGLSELGLDVDIVVGERRVATVGPNARSGALARAAGFEGVQVDAPPRRVQIALGALVAGIAVGIYLAVRKR